MLDTMSCTLARHSTVTLTIAQCWHSIHVGVVFLALAQHWYSVIGAIGILTVPTDILICSGAGAMPFYLLSGVIVTN